MDNHNGNINQLDSDDIYNDTSNKIILTAEKIE